MGGKNKVYPEELMVAVAQARRGGMTLEAVRKKFGVGHRTCDRFVREAPIGELPFPVSGAKRPPKRPSRMRAVPEGERLKSLLMDLLLENHELRAKLRAS